MSIYAHHCPCGKAPTYGHNTLHKWEGKLMAGWGFHCLECGASYNAIGGGLVFALKCWNEKYPAHEGAIQTAELNWDWLIMGGRVSGYVPCVASIGDRIINVTTGAEFEWPHTITEYSMPKGCYTITLSPTKKKDQRRLLQLLEEFQA